MPRLADGDIEKIYVEDNVRSSSFIMPTHHLHTYYELYYLVQGSCRFFVNDRLYDFRPGDMLMIPPGTIHYTRYLAGASRRIAVYFRKEDLEVQELFGQIRFAERFRSACIMQVSDSLREELTAHFLAVTQEAALDDAFTQARLRLLLMDLLLWCVRFCSFPEELPQAIHTTDQAIVRAARYISLHYKDNITSAMIAGEAGFSPNYFSRRFREATGMGIHDYLVLTRLRNAEHLLVSTDRSVTEIALSCGFSDSGYFKDAFRRIYGMSPTAYRKSKTGPAG